MREETQPAPDACRLTEQDMDTLLSKLSSAGLIKLSGKGDPRDIQSYIPARNSSDVSLLDILEATGEPSELQPSHY